MYTFMGIPYIYMESTIHRFEEGECYGCNNWLENVDGKNVILTDFHNGVAQLLVLNDNEKNFNLAGIEIKEVELNGEMKQGKGTRLWLKVETEPKYI